MPTSGNFRIQRAATWSGVAMAVSLLAGLALAGFLPPPAPDRALEAVGEDYRANEIRIRIGVLIVMAGATLLAPFTAAIAVQMERIEGRHPLLTYVQIMCGACLVLVFLFPAIVWQVAAFRAERAPEITQTLNDLGWIPFVGLVTEFMLQAFVIAIATLADHRDQPVFPRWVAYVNLFAAFGAIPAGLNMFFQTGPVAWNGALAWWLLVAVFFVWLASMIFVLLRAIRGQERAVGALDCTARDPHLRIDRLEAELRALRSQVDAVRGGAGSR